MRSPKQFISEMFVDVSRSLQFMGTWNALRNSWNQSFFQRPVMEGTSVNYDLARSLYRNDNQQYNLGAGFVKPIIDLSVEYIGLPWVTTESADFDAWVNQCIHDHWAPQLLQVWRDSMRDSKTVVRFRQPRLDNPLFTEEDRSHGKVECVPPESVEIQYDPTDPDLVSMAIVQHWIDIDERTTEEIVNAQQPRMKEHHIIETITPDEYRYFDKTNEEELTTWRTSNVLGFVPLWESFNEFDVTLGGGQSDIEPILPFIQQFHECLLQTLAAHKYHSTPKAMFKLKDIYVFLRNNFPEVLDPDTGRIMPGAKISWSGKEIFFFLEGEDAGFIEARSVLGDSKTLMEFLIDCIIIAAEVPKWAILKDQGSTDKDATVQPFEKKIGRKRVMFNDIVIMLVKMVSVANGRTPITPKLVWPSIRMTDLAAKAQAIQQIVLAGDVASSHKWIADETMIQILSGLFPEVNSPSIEQKLAENNVEPAVPAPPAPASDTQGAQTNGKGNPAQAQKALATTTPTKN